MISRNIAGKSNLRKGYHLASNDNTLEDPEILGISRTTDGNLDPRPFPDGAAYENLAINPDPDFFDFTEYKGAFGADNWLRGWTALDEYGHLESVGQEVITDADLEGNTDYFWTSDTEYILDGYVFLEEGGRLFIEPGTVIKGRAIPSSSDVASALIITRGAEIWAEGTDKAPIIFTAEDDDVTDPTDLSETDRGLWGGLIILGRASITDETCEVQIEGVATADPNDPRIFYGDADCNFDDEDDSGILSFVSVRHAGSKLEDGDEINGITLGAVGSTTLIEFVEVFANDDDGIEWFGGTVDVSHAVVAFCKDDSYDWDTGFKGRGQFWLSIHAEDAAGNGAEMDGAKPDDANPGSMPTVF